MNSYFVDEIEPSKKNVCRPPFLTKQICGKPAFILKIFYQISLLLKQGLLKGGKQG